MRWLGTLLLLLAPLLQASDEVEKLCRQIGAKLSSVSSKECLRLGFDQPRFYSVSGKPLLEKHFPARAEAERPIRILFLGGVHGDEFSSVSVTFKWLNKLAQRPQSDYEWLFLPLVNPDGLLKRKGSRVNGNKVDINRNFIPAEKTKTPLQHWATRARKRARYYPGLAPLSEPETRAIHQLIEEYAPSVIISVHAPHGILDVDGVKSPPKKLGPLYLRRLGTYPGSLGNYAWFVKNIPVLTIELPSAGSMPKNREIRQMWSDLNGWIARKSGPQLRVAAQEPAETAPLN
ncbi:DUF2817 domain-containing protein [Marinobacterium jannaschii]|uniref:DUF2817 domain-containing protein n=1 Tax=Marinobacterium jannaschii TaxID=64970 RepID=UPI000687ACC3|nr:DUF2817 domain-containing protein [Marinobacterium jannaschii]